MSHVAFTSAFSNSSDNAPTVNKPAGVGTFYVLTVRLREDLTITWPSGFTEVVTSDADGTLGVRIRVAIRAYTGSEGSTFAATASGWAPWQMRCDLLDTVTALDEHSVVIGYFGYTTTVPLPGASVSVASGQYVLWIGGSASSGTANTPTFTPPAGATSVGVADNGIGNVIAAAQGSPPAGTGGFYGEVGFSAGDTFAGFVATLVFDAPVAPSAPTIDTHPSNQTVTEPATAGFTAAATGETSVQWQYDDGGGWESVSGGSGATTDSYTTGATDVSMNGWQYRAAYTNAEGTTYTNAALLTVTEPEPEPESGNLMLLGVG